MAVGGDRAQHRFAGAVRHGVEEDAVQVIARLFGRDRKARLVDEAAEFGWLDLEARLEAVGRHRGKIAGRQDRQVQARFAGGDEEARIVAGNIELYGRAIGQLADEVIEIIRRRRRLAAALHFGRRRFGNLDVEIGSREAQAVALRGQKHVGQDRDRVAPLHDALHVIERFQERRALDGQPHCFFLSPGPRRGPDTITPRQRPESPPTGGGKLTDAPRSPSPICQIWGSDPRLVPRFRARA
jgi:hypothetical protein